MRVHLTGLGFPEGPVHLGDGRIAFVDLLHQAIRLYEDGDSSIIATVEGAPNGMRFGPDGALYVANNGGLAPLSVTDLRFAEPMIEGRIQRVTLDGLVSDYATTLPGPRPWRPNDLVLVEGGFIVFTDPHDWEVLPDERLYGGGSLCLVRPSGQTDLLAEVPGFPNGLAFGPDGALYVGQTILHRVLRFPWDGRAVGAPEVWSELGQSVNPDGMCWHDDRLIVAGSVGDSIVVVDAEGRILRQLSTGPGSDPTNLCVVSGRLWVTLGLPGQLVSFDLADVLP